MSKNVELHEYIRFIKEQVEESEDPKPKKRSAILDLELVWSEN